MKFITKEILKCLFIILLVSAANAQEESESSMPLPADDEQECGLISPPLIQLDVSVLSSEKGYLNYLTYKDFELYDEEGKLQDIEFFKFDEVENHYVIGFIQKYPEQETRWRDIKINLKLPEEKKEDLGKVSVKVHKGYLLKEN